MGLGTRGLLLVFFATYLGLAQTAPILRIDSGGHTARVDWLAFSPDQTRLVSCSWDKTIRVWDLASGGVQVWRFFCDRGTIGTLAGLAFTPDGTQLYTTSRGEDGWFRPLLLDARTGRVEQVLETARMAASSLVVSSDGRRLAAGGFLNLSYLWDAPSGRGVQTFGTKVDDSFYTEVAFSPDNRYLAIVSQDGAVAIQPLGAPALPPPPQLEPGIHGLDWSRDGRFVALSAPSGVRVVAADTGKEVWERVAGDGPFAVRFSPDGRLLAARCSRRLLVIDAHSGVVQGEHDFGAEAVARGLAWSPDGRLLATDTGDGRLCLLEAASLAVVRRLAGSGQPKTLVAWSDDSSRMAWRNDYRGASRGEDLPIDMAFDLRELAPTAVVAAENWHTTLTERQGRRFDLLDRGRSLVVVEQGREVWRRDYPFGYDTATFTHQGEIVLGGVGMVMRAAGTQPTYLHDYLISSLAPSPDGRLLASCSGDQTVAISALGSDGPVTRLLRLFATADGEWVLWTDQGYYACSPNGERLIGWQINRGLTEVPDYYPAYQFRQQFYRPDIIARVLEAGSVEGAVALADRGRRVATDPATVAADLARIVPPHVTILEPPDESVVTTAAVTIKARVEDPNRRAVTKVTVFRNGRAEPATGQPGDVSQTVALAPGRNVLSITAVNDAGSESVPVGVVVDYRPPAAQAGLQPSLYVLAVGVSQYGQADLKLQYAAKDAQNLAAALSGQQGKLYGQVAAKVLTDGQATKNDILDGLDWLTKEATARDTVVLFIAGHGLEDTQNNYFFLPSDGDPEKLLRTGVRWTELQSVLKQLPSKVIAAIDTCHSGGLLGARGLRPRVYGDALRGLGSTEVGVVTLASCQPNELSLEREEWSNGAFTRALIEAVEGRADRDGDGAVVLYELEAYVLERVKELTAGKQHPSMQRAPTIPLDSVVVKLR